MTMQGLQRAAAARRAKTAGRNGNASQGVSAGRLQRRLQLEEESDADKDAETHVSDDDFELIDDESLASANDDSDKSNAAGVGFEEFKIAKEQERKSYKELVNGSLKELLFSKLKFFHKEIDAPFNTAPNSLCYFVCTHARYHSTTWKTHWPKLNKHVKLMIDTARSNTTSACRNAFRGKSDTRRCMYLV